MLNEMITGIGGIAILVVLYVIISNTLWLLLGSKLLRYLPGVDIKGGHGTLKLAFMLLLSFFGVLNWLVKRVKYHLTKSIPKPLITNEISNSIKRGREVIRSRRQK